MLGAGAADGARAGFIEHREHEDQPGGVAGVEGILDDVRPPHHGAASEAAEAEEACAEAPPGRHELPAADARVALTERGAAGRLRAEGARLCEQPADPWETNTTAPCQTATKGWNESERGEHLGADKGRSSRR